jgi:hypothetical protein
MPKPLGSALQAKNLQPTTAAIDEAHGLKTPKNLLKIQFSTA